MRASLTLQLLENLEAESLYKASSPSFAKPCPWICRTSWKGGKKDRKTNIFLLSFT